MSAQPREAASVILLRPRPVGFEVFLVRRRRGASFMASAYVFPGGGADPGEDARTAAARELFEEAGVLLARGADDDEAAAQASTLETPGLELLRSRVLGGAPATAVLAEAGLTWNTATLTPWSHWITPSAEPRRFSARFFLATLPAGQVPRFDDQETVDQAWVTPAEGLARAGELALPPPQVRTLLELAAHRTLDEVFADARERAAQPHPILPRMAPAPGVGAGFFLLLPWDAEYGTAGTGDAAPLTYHPRWAHGPSRFYLEDRTWKHVDGPGSTTAG